MSTTKLIDLTADGNGSQDSVKHAKDREHHDELQARFSHHMMRARESSLEPIRAPPIFLLLLAPVPNLEQLEEEEMFDPPDEPLQDRMDNDGAEEPEEEVRADITDLLLLPLLPRLFLSLN